MKKVILALSIALVLCVVSWIVYRTLNNHADNNSINDPWLTDFPHGMNYETGTITLSHDHIIQVKPERLQEANNLLSTKSYCELTVDQMKNYAGVLPTSIKKSDKPYLLRNVSFGWGTEGTSVSLYQGNKVGVCTGALGHDFSHVKLSHKPVIVYLPFTPKDVFIGISLAE